MTPELTNLLVQIPLVGIFIWFVMNRDKAAQKEREDRDRAFLAAQDKRDEAYVRALAEISGCLQSHDHKVDVLIATLKTQNDIQAAQIEAAKRGRDHGQKEG